jgi:two-component system response regulator HydG
LFGHVRGSFTGATKDRQGLFRAAGDGTVFLDEIGELSPELQAKLLRVLQESEFRAVGSDTPIPLRARVLAATHRDLEAAIRDKTFRNDLYYRLAVLTVRLPPLRERKEDVAALAQFFLARHGAEDLPITGISPTALEILTEYDWPGNVRELENGIRHAIAVSSGPLIEPEDLPSQLRSAAADPVRQGLTCLQEVERRAILDALESSGGQKLSAARRLGIGKTTLYSKLKEYGIQEPEGAGKAG